MPLNSSDRESTASLSWSSKFYLPLLGFSLYLLQNRLANNGSVFADPWVRGRSGPDVRGYKS